MAMNMQHRQTYGMDMNVDIHHVVSIPCIMEMDIQDVEVHAACPSPHCMSMSMQDVYVHAAYPIHLDPKSNNFLLIC